MAKRFQSPVLRSVIRLVTLFVLLMGTYLVQMCVMPYIRIGGITPSIIFVTMSVVVVGFGRLRGFWTGAFFGILLEVMTPTVSILNLAYYTASSIIAGLIFADHSPQQLEYARAQGRSGTNMNPLIRTPLCCALLTIGYDAVNIIKIYLSGNDLLWVHVSRALIDLVLTLVLCLIFMIPMRRLLRLRTPHSRRSEVKKYEMA